MTGAESRSVRSQREASPSLFEDFVGFPDALELGFVAALSVGMDCFHSLAEGPPDSLGVGVGVDPEYATGFLRRQSGVPSNPTPTPRTRPPVRSARPATRSTSLARVEPALTAGKPTPTAGKPALTAGVRLARASTEPTTVGVVPAFRPDPALGLRTSVASGATALDPVPEATAGVVPDEVGRRREGHRDREEDRRVDEPEDELDGGDAREDGRHPELEALPLHPRPFVAWVCKGPARGGLLCCIVSEDVRGQWGERTVGAFETRRFGRRYLRQSAVYPDMSRGPSWKSVLALLALGGVALAVRSRLRSGPETKPAPESTTDEPQVAPAEPPVPERAYDVINPVMERLLRSPLHGVVSDSLMLITFTGRKTGTEYTTPVGYRQEGDTLTVFTQSDWWKNLRGGQPVRVYLRGEERTGIAEPTADPDEVAGHVRRFVEREGVETARRIGLQVQGEQLPPDDELAAGVEGVIAIEIELE